MRKQNGGVFYIILASFLALALAFLLWSLSDSLKDSKLTHAKFVELNENSLLTNQYSSVRIAFVNKAELFRSHLEVKS